MLANGIFWDRCMLPEYRRSLRDLGQSPSIRSKLLERMERRGYSRAPARSIRLQPRSFIGGKRCLDRQRDLQKPSIGAEGTSQLKAERQTTVEAAGDADRRLARHVG